MNLKLSQIIIHWYKLTFLNEFDFTETPKELKMSVFKKNGSDFLLSETFGEVTKSFH